MSNPYRDELPAEIRADIESHEERLRDAHAAAVRFFQAEPREKMRYAVQMARVDWQRLAYEEQVFKPILDKIREMDSFNSLVALSAVLSPEEMQRIQRSIRESKTTSDVARDLGHLASIDDYRAGQIAAAASNVARNENSREPDDVEEHPKLYVCPECGDRYDCLICIMQGR